MPDVRVVPWRLLLGFGVKPVPIRMALGRLRQRSWRHGGIQEGPPQPRCCAGGGGLSPPGDIRVAAHCGGLCDARSGGEPHIWARSRLLEAAAPQPGDRAVIKAALVLLPPLARALPRHPLAALGSGPGAWGRWWRWGCSCACSCVGVSAGRAGAEPAAVAGPAQQPPCRRLRGAASGGRRRALCRARGGEARR